MKRIAFKFIVVIIMVVVATGSGKVRAQVSGPLPSGNGGQSTPLDAGQVDGPMAATASLQLLPEKAALVEPPEWKWYIVAGDVFSPASNTMTWTVLPGGCLEPMVAGSWRASVNLPDGSVLTRLDFGFFNDTNSPGSTAYLKHYDSAGTETIISSGYALGNINLGMYAFLMVPISNVVINNRYGAYEFVWTGSTAQHLSFLRVAYVPPNAFGVALPLVQKTP